MKPAAPTEPRVGWDFISLYTLAFVSTNLLSSAAADTLQLKVSSVVGIKDAPNSLAV